MTCITKEPTELLWLSGKEFSELGLAKVFNDELAARKDTLERYALTRTCCTRGWASHTRPVVAAARAYLLAGRMTSWTSWR